ncbi:hypothetical protein [Gordonibacter sp. An230]|uniref:hypothetical protein n=1 Tax=Gordonibacter sp. An230 TaxID=1965592 RepID=UPI00194E5DD6|nr:hypothetical protein [Gordonibacter sp. An230]
MYEVTLEETWDLFGSYLDGSRSALVCAVSESSLSARARSALESSLEALGYGRESCAYATLDAEIDSAALFLLLEGIDPLCLIATDETAARALGKTYRCHVEPMMASRAFGRTVVAFRNFDTMLDDAQSKQTAWALLKKLPRLGAH